MTDRPKIPHEPLPENQQQHAATEGSRASKRWTRKLAEKGKLTSPGKRIPLYRMKRQTVPDQPA